MAKRLQSLDLQTIAIRHQVALERYKNGVIKGLAPEISKIDDEIVKVLGQVDFTDISGKTELQRIIRDLRDAQKAVYDGVIEKVESGFADLAEYESIFEIKSIIEATKSVADINVDAPTAKKIMNAVYNRPLPSSGEYLADFWKNWKSKEIRTVENAVVQGYANGRTTDEIVRSLIGTKKAKYKDCILARVRREAETAVRTSVQHVATQARMATFEANKDLITGYKLVATLDSRTSAICRSLDQTTYELGEGPTPPLHANCRTAMVAELHSDFDFLKEGATRSSLDGQIDASQTYYGWLKEQPDDFQDDVIGPVRGKLLRDGGLTADEFARLNLGRDFRPLTLEQMRQREPLAFERAGI